MVCFFLFCLFGCLWFFLFCLVVVVFFCSVPPLPSMLSLTWWSGWVLAFRRVWRWHFAFPVIITLYFLSSCFALEVFVLQMSHRKQKSGFSTWRSSRVLLYWIEGSFFLRKVWAPSATPAVCCQEEAIAVFLHSLLGSLSASVVLPLCWGAALCIPPCWPSAAVQEQHWRV